MTGICLEYTYLKLKVIIVEVFEYLSLDIDCSSLLRNPPFNPLS